MAVGAADSMPGADARQSLSPAGIVGVGLLAAVLVGMLAVAVEGFDARRDVARVADAVLAEADTLLRDVDGELDALAIAASGRCDADAREQLLRASLRSERVQAFLRIEPDGAATCGPSPTRAFVDRLAPEAAQQVGQAPAGQRLLLPGESLAPSLIVGRSLGGGAAVLALIDLRHFGVRVQAAAGSAHAAWSVQTVDGYTLVARRAAAGGGGRVAAAADVPLAAAVRRSVELPVTVSAEIGWAAAGARLRVWSGAYVLGALLLAAAGIAGLQALIRRRDRPEAGLRRALRRRRFEPVVQPIVDARSGHCVGAEVLLRGVHPIRGLVSPVGFIGLAEATGLIGPISEILVTKARDQLAPIAREHPALYFSFNIAPAQLLDPGLPARLAAAFDEASLPVSRVLLEITERDAVRAEGLRGLDALRRHGFRLAIDDFGTGHSSLAALENLDVDRLKIDRAFVRRIGDPDATHAVLDAIVGLSRRLRIPMIAEGVETDAQWRYLRERGVESLQGYLFARPMPVAEFARWLVRARGEVASDAPDDLPPSGRARIAMPWAPSAGARHAGADPDRLLAAMCGPQGVDIRDRVWHLTVYRRCFVGSEAVDWLVAHEGIDRTQALRLGQRLAALGLIEHVAQEHDFADALLFYRPAGAAADGGAGAEAPASVPAGVDLRELAGAMRACAAEGGLSLASHDWRGVRYRQSFTGLQATGWLERRLGIDRTAAVSTGGAMVRAGLLRHVSDERPFAASGEPFRFG
jgi:sensor c-di-GMP phosphodiesterase-like protein